MGRDVVTSPDPHFPRPGGSARQRAADSHGLLGPYRALDLTDYRGHFCGRILADLGADVIKVEPPGGDSGRNIGPFYGNVAHPERSLYWFAYNANKRGITLDIARPDGQALLKRLAGTADFVLESCPPGFLDRIGLGYAALSEISPRLVLVSITDFGQTGPYRDMKGSDLVSSAMSGYLYLTGDPDRPPVRVGFPQSYTHASAQAAAGALVAHYCREITGRGDHVDISIQEALIPCTINAVSWWEMSRKIIQRAGALRLGLGANVLRQTWRCQDGLVSFVLFSGPQNIKINRAISKWLDDEGLGTDFVRQMDWTTFDLAEVPQSTIDQIQEPLGKLFLRHTKADLFRAGKERGVAVYPVSSTHDIMADEQLAQREFWTGVEHPHLGTSITYPGVFIRSSRASLPIRRQAPMLGQHNEEVYVHDLGLSREDLRVLKEAGVI